jgi:glycine betaine/proline transport system substrate-binding protein
MKRNRLSYPVLLAFAVLIILLLFAAACIRTPTTRTIKIADMGWTSNVPIINIMKLILTDELGYDVEFAATLWPAPTFLALAKDSPDVDIYAECWLPNQQSLVDEYVTDKGQAEVVSTSYGGAPQGWAVPRYVIEGDPERGIEPMAPNLRSVAQLNDYINLFDRNQDGRGDLVGGPSGWLCTEISNWQLESWGLNYDQMVQEEWVAWSLLTAAHLEGEPILLYCYEPAWPSLQFDLVWLETPPHGDEAWADYYVWKDWKAGKTVSWRPGSACGYPPADVVVVVTDEFSNQYPDAYRFLRNWSIPKEDLTVLCAQIELERLPVGYVAAKYIKEHPELVNQWLLGTE